MAKYDFEVEKTFKFKLYTDGKQIECIYMTLQGTSLQIENKDIFLTNGEADITINFIDYLFKFCADHEYTFVSKINKTPLLNHIREFLLQSKFSYDENTVNYIKGKDNIESPFKDEYSFEPYLNRGKEYFINILKQCAIGDLYYELKSIEDTYNEWMSNNHNDTFWSLVFKDGEIIGVILPIENPNMSHLGNIDYIGVVPDARRKGHGVKLHNIALDILFNDLQATMYLGMTHRDNKHMIDVFEKNHCLFHDVIVFNTQGVTE